MTAISGTVSIVPERDGAPAETVRAALRYYAAAEPERVRR